MKKELTYRGAVQSWECDSNGHMNVMYYINKYELAGRNLISVMGLRKSYMEANNLGIAVVEQQVKYIQEVFEDDLLFIETSIESIDNKVFTVYHEMKNRETDKIASTAQIKLLAFDKKLRKAVPIPDEVRAKMEAMMNA